MLRRNKSTCSLSIVRVVHFLEGVQNRVEADFVVQCIFGVLLELLEQHGLLGAVKGVDDFVSKTHEAVNGINGLTKRRSQEPMPMENEVLYAFVVSTLHARHTSSYS